MRSWAHWTRNSRRYHRRDLSRGARSDSAARVVAASHFARGRHGGAQAGALDAVLRTHIGHLRAQGGRSRRGDDGLAGEEDDDFDRLARLDLRAPYFSPAPYVPLLPQTQCAPREPDGGAAQRRARTRRG